MGLDDEVLEIADEDCWKREMVLDAESLPVCNVSYYHPELFEKGFECEYIGNWVIMPDIEKACLTCRNGDRYFSMKNGKTNNNNTLL